MSIQLPPLTFVLAITAILFIQFLTLYLMQHLKGNAKLQKTLKD